MADLKVEKAILELTQEIKFLNYTRFKIRIPYIYTISTREIETMGSPISTVNGQAVANNFNEPVKVCWQFFRLIQLFKEGGVTMSLWGTQEEIKEATIKIYSITQELLEKYKNYGSRSIHSLPVEVAYIKALDEFGDLLFNVGKHTLVEDASTTDVNTLIFGGGFLNAGPALSQPNPVRGESRSVDRFDPSRYRDDRTSFGNTPSFDVNTAYRESHFK